VELWGVECQRPKWDGGAQLTLAVLMACYGPWMKSPQGYRANVERSRKGANGEYDTPKSTTHQARAAPPPQVGRTAAQVAPAFKRRAQAPGTA
jgi:hypothetical protein